MHLISWLPFFLIFLTFIQMSGNKQICPENLAKLNKNIHSKEIMTAMMFLYKNAQK